MELKFAGVNFSQLSICHERGSYDGLSWADRF